MAERRPLVQIGGRVKELPQEDTVPGAVGGDKFFVRTASPTEQEIGEVGDVGFLVLYDDTNDEILDMGIVRRTA